ncbi:MAG: hypothetical protein ABR600_12310 [Actinomycetota bacterium]
MRHRTLLASVMALSLVLALAGFAGAATDTTLSIDGVTPSTGTVVLSGSIAVGDIAKAPVQVMEDGSGDDADGAVPDGLDLASASIKPDAAGKLVFTINTNDMNATVGTQTPTFVYDWYVSVDGIEKGYFLQAGFVGGFGEANTGKFFKLCVRTSSVTCATNLTGTIGNNAATITVSPSQIGVKPGSLIDVGTGNGSACPGICSTWQPIEQHFHDTGGDDAIPVAAIWPGGVSVAVVPAATADDAIDFATTATVGSTGTWTAQVPTSGLVSGASYKAAARSCSGLAEAPVCVVTTRVFTA